MKNILKIFKKNHGYAYLKELKANKIHTAAIRKLLDQGVIEKVKPGLYKLTNFPIAAHQGLVDVCMAMPRAVVCLHSALSYYQLTTTVPGAVMVALPRGAKPPKLFYPPVQVFYFSKPYHQTGIETLTTGQGTFRIYSREKTVVDCFRYRNRLGEDVAIEGLKNYLQSGKIDLSKLFYFARLGRMSGVIRPYVGALVS